MIAHYAICRNPARGFTLIEIVGVVTTGLLPAIVAPNVIRNLDVGAVTRAKQDTRTIEVALGQFRFDHFRYPDEEGGDGVNADIGSWNLE
jgi:type II secretory pathway pseudopilin PulG